MRTSRRPAAVVGLAVGLVTFTVAATGCSLASPAIITTPYAASDGSNGEVGVVKFRNFLAVAEAKGEPGVVVGAVATDGQQPARVRLTVLGPDGSTSLGETSVTVQPGQLVTVGTGENAPTLTIKDVPVVPGSVLTLRATTDAGNTDLSLPVLPAERQYESLTPEAEPSSS